MHYLDYTLRDRDLGHPAITGIEVTHGYIKWFYTISQPHIIALEEDVHIPKPIEHEALSEITAEQEGDHGYLELTGMFNCVRDHVLSIMGSGAVESGSAE